MKRIITTVSGLTIGALALTACGGGGDGGTDGGTEALAPDTSEVCTEDRVGGEITIGEYAMLPSFAPGQGHSGSYGAAQSAAVYDRLMRWDPENEEFEPKLAESLESNDDYTEWTLTLPEGVTFSNGESLTADDVAFTLDLHQDPATQSRAVSDAQNVENIEVTDPLTVHFTLTEPWSGFPLLLAGSAGEVIPQDTYQEVGPDDWARNPIGAGPFMVDNYIPDQETVLVPNPDYYGGVVCPTLRFSRIAGGQGTLDTLNTGEFQVGFLRGGRYVTAAQDEGHSGYADSISAGSILNMNSGKSGYDGILTDERIRQAVSHAIDRELYDDRMTGGVGQSASALLAESSRFYDGAEGLTYDPERARALLDEARADHPEWDGTLSLLTGDSPENQESGIVIQALLDAVGFTVETESVPISQTIARQFQGDYELTVSGLATSDADPSTVFSDGMIPDGPTNNTGIDDPELAEAVNTVRTATDNDDQVNAYNELQEVFNRASPFAVLAHAEEFVAVSDSVSGVMPSAYQTMLYDQAFVRP